METTQNLEVNTCHYGKQLIAWDQHGYENSFTEKRRRNLDHWWAPQIATFPMEGFRWNITQDNSNEEMMGLNISFLITCESWKTKENCQEWYKTTSKDNEEELHFGMHDKERLSSSNKNLEEHIENKLIPWWTIM